MDLIQAKTKIAEWEKTLSTIERQKLNHLVNKRKEAQKKVDHFIKEVEKYSRKKSWKICASHSKSCNNIVVRRISHTEFLC